MAVPALGKLVCHPRLEPTEAVVKQWLQASLVALLEPGMVGTDITPREMETARRFASRLVHHGDYHPTSSSVPMIAITGTRAVMHAPEDHAERHFGSGFNWSQPSDVGPIELM